MLPAHAALLHSCLPILPSLRLSACCEHFLPPAGPFLFKGQLRKGHRGLLVSHALQQTSKQNFRHPCQGSIPPLAPFPQVYTPFPKCPALPKSQLSKGQDPSALPNFPPRDHSTHSAFLGNLGIPVMTHGSPPSSSTLLRAALFVRQQGLPANISSFQLNAQMLPGPFSSPAPRELPCPRPASSKNPNAYTKIKATHPAPSSPAG